MLRGQGRPSRQRRRIPQADVLALSGVALDEAFEKDDPVLDQSLMHHRQLSLEQQRKLFGRASAGKVEYLFQNPTLHPDIQNEIIEGDDAFAKKWLALNPSIDLNTQLALLEVEDFGTWLHLATNSNLALEAALILDARAEDELSTKGWALQGNLAANKGLPYAFRWRYTKHEDTGVRCQMAYAVGSDISVDEALVLDITRDPNCHVRAALVKGGNIPERVLAVLLKDPDVTVRSEVATSLPVDDQLAAELMKDDLNVRYALVRNPRLSLSTLFALCDDPVAGIREFVAVRKDLPNPVVDVLLRDPVSEVAASIAAYQPISSDVAWELFKRDDVVIRRGLALNYCPKDLQLALVSTRDWETMSNLADAQHLDLDENWPVAFIQDFYPERLCDLLGFDEETFSEWKGLIETWPGSVGQLARAIKKLTARQGETT